MPENRVLDRVKRLNEEKRLVKGCFTIFFGVFNLELLVS